MTVKNGSENPPQPFMTVFYEGENSLQSFLTVNNEIEKPHVTGTTVLPITDFPQGRK